MMKLKLIRTTWGILDGANQEPLSWEPLFQKLKSEGYEGIEFCVGPFNPFSTNFQLFNELRVKYNFDVITQIQTCGYPLSSHKIEDHIASFKELVIEAKKWGALFVNAHSGSDTWNVEKQVQFFNECILIEKEFNIIVNHETHRRRALYNPFLAKEVLEKVPTLHITFDVSHWVVLCERIFDSTDEAQWWNETLDLVASRTRLIHARVGYSDGPQVTDPSAPEFQPELEAHLKWWKKVWASLVQRGHQFAFVEPEHGPHPYLHSLPHTRMPVADLWAVNSWVGRKVAEEFHTFSSATVLKSDAVLFPSSSDTHYHS